MIKKKLQYFSNTLTPFDGEKLSSRIFDEAKKTSFLKVLVGTPEPRSTTAGPDAKGHSTAVTPPMPQTHGLRYAEKQKKNNSPAARNPAPQSLGGVPVSRRPQAPARHRTPNMHTHKRYTQPTSRKGKRKKRGRLPWIVNDAGASITSSGRASPRIAHVCATRTCRETGPARSPCRACRTRPSAPAEKRD